MYLELIQAITPLLLIFMTEECVDTIFVKFNILDADCLKLIISKGLGYAIVAGSMFVKFPQIVKIYNSASIAGLSLATFVLETVCVIVTVSYNYAQSLPFSTWGESFFILLQLIILLSQYFHYTSSKVLLLVAPVLIPTLTWLLTTLPHQYLTLCLTASIPLMALSKILQIKSNFMNGHTGQLSFITNLMNFLGCLARLFTVIQEVDDSLILFNIATVFSLNTIIVLQFLMYWSVVPPKEKSS